MSVKCNLCGDSGVVSPFQKCICQRGESSFTAPYMTTPTPETNLLIGELVQNSGFNWTSAEVQRIAEHAIRLERERDEARRAITKYACTGESSQQTIDRIYKAACEHQTERDKLRHANETLRNAQKACEHCDGPTLEETKQLREAVDAAIAVLKLLRDAYWAQTPSDIASLADKALAAYAALPHVKGQR